MVCLFMVAFVSLHPAPSYRRYRRYRRQIRLVFDIFDRMAPHNPSNPFSLRRLPTVLPSPEGTAMLPISKETVRSLPIEDYRRLSKIIQDYPRLSKIGTIGKRVCKAASRGLGVLHIPPPAATSLGFHRYEPSSPVGSPPQGPILLAGTFSPAHVTI